MQLLFIRHGQATSNIYNPEGVVGQPASLTPEGIDQIHQTAQRLGRLITVSSIYSSPLLRARQSVKIIADQLSLTIWEDPRLREIYKGDWEGLPVSEVMNKEAQIDIDERHLFRPPGGENWQDVGERVVDFVHDLNQQSDQQQIVAVSHDHTIRMGIGALMQRPVEVWGDLPVGLGSIIGLKLDRDKWVIDAEISEF
jgi:broad specificity phosphatase PhoE